MEYGNETRTFPGKKKSVKTSRVINKENTGSFGLRITARTSQKRPLTERCEES